MTLPNDIAHASSSRRVKATNLMQNQTQDHYVRLKENNSKH